MATQTTNLKLKKPAYSDVADIMDINDNMDALDKAVAGAQNGLAVIANGNTHAAISSGQYVYVRGHSSLAEGLYRATASIATNASLSTGNLSAVSTGGLNGLQSQIDTLNSKFTTNFSATGNSREEFVTNLIPIINDKFNIENLSVGTVIAGSVTWQGHGYVSWMLTRTSGGANIVTQIYGQSVTATVNASTLAISDYTDLNRNTIAKSDIVSVQYSGTTNNKGNYGLSSSVVPTSATIIAVKPNENSVYVSLGKGSSGTYMLHYESADNEPVVNTTVSGTIRYIQL